MPALVSFDEEFGDMKAGVAPEQERQPPGPRLRYLWLLLPGAVIVFISTVVWPDNMQQLWAVDWFAQGPSAERTANRKSAGSEDHLIVFDALKKEISELRYAQQQIRAEIAALQTAQQELERSSAKIALSWFSEHSALLYQGIAPAPKPRTTARRSQTTTTREANANPQNENRPMPLVRSQVTAPGAVPIR
jgi:hypothetical protein